jgi:predicted kinase
VAAIPIPDPSLVVLVGAAGAGKSTFAGRHFAADEVLSSDAFRALVSGDEADQRATRTAFSILHRQVVARLAAGRLVVVDATNVERHARRALLVRAAAAGVPAVAIVLALPETVVHARNAGRSGRVVESDVVARHLERLAAAGGGSSAELFGDEGFGAVHVLRSVAAVEAARIERRPWHRPPLASPRSSS